MQRIQPQPTLLLLLLCLIGFNAIAQKDIASYGKIDPEDLKMTVCDFDKEAPAMVLIKKGELWYDKGSDDLFDIRTRFRVRIKILKQGGLEKANVKLNYYARGGYENIYSVKGATYNLAENGEIKVTKLESKNIYNQPINKRFSSTVFSMPDVKVGSVIEYEYVVQRQSETYISDWEFQDDIPTRVSQFDMTVPNFYNYTISRPFTYPLEYKVDSKQETIGIRGVTGSYQSTNKIYTMRNIPALHDEPFMTSNINYIQKLKFQIASINFGFEHQSQINSWGSLMGLLKSDDDFWGQLKKNISFSDSLNMLLKRDTSSFYTMETIYKYVRSNITYNGYESFWSDEGIKDVWNKHSGNSGDINLLLIKLLRKAGLTAFPLLVSSREHGAVNIGYPSVNQFNNVLAFVKIGDNVYILDATNKVNSVRLVPENYLNTMGFLITDESYTWYFIKESYFVYKEMVSILGEITESGLFKGTATINSFDYAKNKKLEKWQTNKIRFKDLFTSVAYPSMQMDSLNVTQQENDSLPLLQTFDFKTPLNTTGDYQYFNTNLFLNFEKNPFVSEERFSQVDFGFNQQYLLYANITIPDGYVFEELPKNVKLITVDSSISVLRMSAVNDSTQFSLRLEINYKRNEFTETEYPDLKEFYKKLYAILNEQIVFRKK